MRRPGVRLDNVALVPASLLPQRDRYQALANRLPQGEVLLVLPHGDSPQRRTLKRTAALLRAKGRRVTVLAEERFDAAGER